MGMIKGKAWGTTELLLKTPMIEIHRLLIMPNAYCSLHSHRFKHNAFHVASGRLTIEVHKNDYALVDKTLLGPGGFTTVAPNEFHRFVAGETPVDAIEIYYPEELSEDIVRKDVGGVGVRA